MMLSLFNQKKINNLKLYRIGNKVSQISSIFEAWTGAGAVAMSRLRLQFGPKGPAPAPQPLGKATSIQGSKPVFLNVERSVFFCVYEPFRLKMCGSAVFFHCSISGPNSVHRKSY